MKMNEMFPSNYLKKEDVGNGVTVTIRQVTQEEVAGDGGKELKAVLHFQGNMKPMILNRGNAELLCSLYGDDSVAWHGRQIEVYSDPSVMFAGKRVGGIRLRVPSNNGNGHSGFQNGQALWDISDGKSVMTAQTADQVRKIINDSGAQPSAFKVKPAGAPREQAKPADQCGFGTPTVEDRGPEGDIPF